MKRVAQIAKDADVPLGGPGCGPNFAAIVTPEPEQLLKEWWSETIGSSIAIEAWAA